MSSNEHSTVFMFGDFNMPDVDWVEGIGYPSESSPSCVTTNSLSDNLLIQIVDQPTQFRHQQQPSLLDLVITNDPEQVLSISYHPALGSSDHVCILTEIQINNKKENMIKKSFTDYEQIRQDLSRIKMENIANSGDIEKSWETFKVTVLDAEKKNTQEYWCLLPETLPYLPKEVKRAMKKKKRAWAKYVKCKCDNHHDRFKKCRNRLRNLTRKVMRDHKDAIAANSKQNPKMFWRHVSAANPSRQDIPDLMREDGKKASDTKEKVHLLNSN